MASVLGLAILAVRVVALGSCKSHSRSGLKCTSSNVVSQVCDAYLAMFVTFLNRAGQELVPNSVDSDVELCGELGLGVDVAPGREDGSTGVQEGVNPGDGGDGSLPRVLKLFLSSGTKSHFCYLSRVSSLVLALLLVVLSLVLSLLLRWLSLALVLLLPVALSLVSMLLSPETLSSVPMLLLLVVLSSALMLLLPVTLSLAVKGLVLSTLAALSAARLKCLAESPTLAVEDLPAVLEQPEC